MNPRQMTMVVARYHEDLDWLKQAPCNYVVYNKGGSLPEWVKNEIKLPNIGYEPHTYLTYIVNNYDNLPEYTIFVQGNPFDHSRELIKKINNFDGSADFFPLSDHILREDGYGNPWRSELRIIDSARKIFLKNDTESFEFPHGAQFIASKKAILFHTKMAYQKILDFLIEEKHPDEECVIINKEAAIFKMFSAKFPRGKSFVVPKKAISFHEKMTRQKIRDFLSGAEPSDNVDIHGNFFSACLMEFLWKTLFDGEHKTIYD